MKTHRELELQLHNFLPEHQTQESGHLYVPDPSPPVPTVQRVGCAPEPVWTLWRRENSLSQPSSNPDSSVVQPVP
jgi:hypothetical protein